MSNNSRTFAPAKSPREAFRQSENIYMVPVVQLVRMSDCGSRLDH